MGDKWGDNVLKGEKYGGKHGNRGLHSRAKSKENRRVCERETGRENLAAHKFTKTLIISP